MSKRDWYHRSLFIVCWLALLCSLCGCFGGSHHGQNTDGPTESQDYQEDVETLLSPEEPLNPQDSVTGQGSEAADDSSKEVAVSSDAWNIVLNDVDGNGKNYVFTYHGEEYSAQYTEDNWKIIDSYRITNIEDITAICKALLNLHPVHGSDMQSIRTAEDMAFEWLQHNLAYELLPEGNPWRRSAKDVDLNPEDQNRTFQEIYENRTGKPFRIEDFLK